MFLSILIFTARPANEVLFSVDARSIKCTPHQVFFLQEKRHCDYPYLIMYLNNSQVPINKFQEAIRPFLESNNLEQKRIAHLGLGWSLYPNALIQLPSQDALTYLESYYNKLGGTHDGSIQALSESYLVQGKIEEALACALACDRRHVMQKLEPHSYVRLLCLTSKNKGQPIALNILRNGKSPEKQNIFYFLYTYLKQSKGLQPEVIVQRDSTMRRYIKDQKNKYAIPNPNETDVLFYWRAWYFSTDERNRYNQLCEKRIQGVSTENAPLSPNTTDKRKVTFDL